MTNTGQYFEYFGFSHFVFITLMFRFGYSGLMNILKLKVDNRIVRTRHLNLSTIDWAG
jgi:hypothetical protein